VSLLFLHLPEGQDQLLDFLLREQIVGIHLFTPCAFPEARGVPRILAPNSPK
jgi:hypothetical protein